jgi:hypothetical protein
VRDLGRHAVLVVTTEVDDAVGPLVTAADVPGRDPAGVVAAAALAERADQRLLRRGPGDLDERFSVWTESTLTLKICSMAILISVLFDRGSTRNVYLPSSRSP